MKLHKRHFLFVTIAATLIAPAAFAGSATNRSHSERVIRNAGNTASTEVDYESRGAMLRASARSRLAARHFGEDNLAIASFATTSAAASGGADPLIVYFNFNDSGVTNGNPATATALTSDAPGTEGATSAITTNFPALTMTTGTRTNLAGGDLTSSGQSLSMSAASANNGDYIQFNANGLTFQDFVLTQAVRSTISSTKGGFGSITLSYSTVASPTNADFTTFGTATVTRDATFNTVTFDLSAVSALDNQANLTFRETFNTVSGSTGGTTQIDNIQLNAVTAVPEPSTYFGAALALVAIGWLQRRRLMSLIAIA